MEKSSEWKNKFNEICQICSDELKKTTEIGKRMLSASKANTTLNEAYEELGILAAEAIKNNKLNWENERVQTLLKTIEGCRADLDSIEEQVNDIRFSDEEENKDSN